MNVKVLKEYIELMGSESNWAGLKEFAQLIQDIDNYQDAKIGYM